MRKLLISLFLFNCICSAAFAQNATADSLKQLLATAKEDTARVLLMYQLGRSFANSKPDTALTIAGQALELSRKIDFKKGQVMSLIVTGNVLMNKGNYPRSLEILLEALKIAEETADDLNTVRIRGALGDVYFYLGDIKRSLDYSRQVLSVHRKLNDSARMVGTLANIGDTYEKLDQLDSALAYTRLAYQISVSQNNLNSQSIGLNNLGNIFRKQGKIDTAMSCYRTAVTLFKQTDNDAAVGEAYLGMAKIFLQEKKTDSCLFYAKLSFNVSKSLERTDLVLAASSFLAEYYKSARNVDSAYAYQSATIVAKDSLFSQQKINQAQSMTYDESMRRQQVEEVKQQERERLKQNAFIGGLSTLLIVAFILYINNRQKRKANALLQKQKEEIDDKAKELSVQKDNVELLSEIGRKITASLSVEKIIGTVYDNVNALMDASVFGIGIYNDALKRIEFPATYEDGKALPFYYNSINDPNRFAVSCFKEGKEIIIGNLDEEYKLHLQEVQTPHEGKQAVSLIYLPLVVKEKKLGVITVQSFRQNAYSDYHLFMLRNIAIYTAIALENAESFETLNQTVVRLKSAQAQLIQSEKMASLGELTAGVAHEIQNPLNFVNNFSEVSNELIDEMKTELLSGNDQQATKIADDLRQNLEKILHHGKRADSIVKSMLLHSRTSSLQRELTDVNALADEYLRLSYHGMRARDKNFNVTMQTDFDDTIEKMNIVPQEIGRALLNLYNNAFYAVTEKKKQLNGTFEPTISVYTKRIDNRIEIQVKDNGDGIPRKILDKIFQPFFTTKPTGQGTGLGLSLSYDIVKAHGGEIRAEAEEGEGSEFLIVLPA